MQFTKNTSSGKASITGIVIKLTLGLIVVIGIVFFINSLDFPSPKKEIEKKLGMTISEIFQKNGEKYFRKIEETITLNLLRKNKSVISLGGGAFMNENIRKEVLRSHISFWLNWNSNILLGRIKNSKKRPLAINSSDDQIIDLIQKRSNVYAQALFEIKCDNLTKNEVVNRIIKIYESN